MRLKPGFRDPATVTAVAGRIKNYDFIDDVRFGEEWVQKLYRIRNIATLAGRVLGLAFAAVAVIIIGATIRMAVLARARDLDHAPRGRDRRFIRSPFLIEGLLKGTLGGLLALLLTWLANSLIGTVRVQRGVLRHEVRRGRSGRGRADRPARQRVLDRVGPSSGGPPADTECSETPPAPPPPLSLFHRGAAPQRGSWRRSASNAPTCSAECRS